MVDGGGAAAVHDDPLHLAGQERGAGPRGRDVDGAREEARIDRRLVREEERAAGGGRDRGLEPADRALVEDLHREPMPEHLLRAPREHLRVRLVERDLEGAERAEADRHAGERLDLADERRVALEGGAAQRVEGPWLDRLHAR